MNRLDSDDDEKPMTEDTGSTGSSSETSSLKDDHRFMSAHRRSLLHIAQDGMQNVRHRVPSREKRTTSWRKKARKSCQDTINSRTRDEWIGTFLPMWKWLKPYQWKANFLTDVLAGLTVGVMVVPQSMSYAKLAGLPVEFGLYSALVPVLAYALFGSSRQLAVGPVALISLMLQTELTRLLSDAGKSPEDPDYTALYTTLAIQTSFLVGIMYIAMGLLRLGFVTFFLSHAVVSGFTTGAAVIIGMSQLKYIFGYDIESSKVLHDLLYNLFSNIDQFNYRTFLMGMSSIALLVLMKYVGKNYPRFKFMRALGPLTVTVLSIIVTWAGDLENKGIPIVGAIPSGLPNFTANLWLPISDLGSLMTVVITITIVGFMESIAIAKQLASKHKYELDSSLELIGLGMANFFGAMFQAYPVTGSFSRSAVNNESNAQSGISGIVTACLVGLVLLFLTPIFEHLPLCVLAAIVISGVIGLLDYEEAIYLWKVHKFDFFVWLVACLGTMFLGVEIGLAIAVIVSLLLVIYESAYPHTAVLGRLPGTTVYRNVKQYPEAERYDGIVMVRIDASIHFLNTQNIREKLEKYEAAAEALLAEEGKSDAIKFVILDLSPVPHVDTSGLHILTDMLQTYQEQGIQLCFSNPNVTVMQRFRSSGFAGAVGEEHIFVTSHDAVSWCLNELDSIAVSVHESMSSSSHEVDLEEQSSAEEIST